LPSFQLFIDIADVDFQAAAVSALKEVDQHVTADAAVFALPLDRIKHINFPSR